MLAMRPKATGARRHSLAAPRLCYDEHKGTESMTHGM
jgi:hypothetical protein